MDPSTRWHSHSYENNKHQMASYEKGKHSITANWVPGVVYVIGFKECPQVYMGETKCMV